MASGTPSSPSVHSLPPLWKQVFLLLGQRLHGALWVCEGVETASDFLPAYLCFGPICQMAMPVQVKAARFQSRLCHLPAVDAGWVTDLRPPLFAQLCSAEA